jgi:Flp pilus assembly pilin Flp
MRKRHLEERRKPESAPRDMPAPPVKRKRRRGATAMEYLVALSFIVVVLILAVQHIGSITGGLLGNSAKATKFRNSSSAGP